MSARAASSVTARGRLLTVSGENTTILPVIGAVVASYVAAATKVRSIV